MKSFRVLVSCVFVFVMGSAQAALIDRGGGLIYDSALNVTWLQDANYALTSLQFRNGASWGESKQWVDGLVYHDAVRNIDISDWRLPGLRPTNGISYDTNSSFSGATDVGFNITNPASELAYMFYVNLGNKGNASPEGFFPQQGAGLVNTGPFINLVSLYYWSGSELYPQPDYDYFAFAFSMLAGLQELRVEWEPAYAWAVRDGDVAAIPEPETYTMLAAGLLLLAAVEVRRKQLSGRTSVFWPFQD